MKTIEELINAYKKASKSLVNARKYAYYAVTYHSTAIEGSTLTQSQVTNLLEYGKTVSTKAFWEHQMVVDNYNAMKFVAMQAGKKRPISPEFISEISALVMKGTGSIENAPLGTFDISRGEYRKCSVRAGNRIFPDSKKVPALVVELCNYLNSELKKVKTISDKLNLSFIAQYRLVSIHPFGDGNGRVSRLLMNYIQLYFGLPSGIVLKKDKLRYIETMELARKTSNINPYLAFMNSQYRNFLKSGIKEFKK